MWMTTHWTAKLETRRAPSSPPPLPPPPPSDPPKKTGKKGSGKRKKRWTKRQKKKLYQRAASDSSDTEDPTNGAPAPVVQKNLPPGEPRKRGTSGQTLASEFYTAGAVAAKGWRAPVTIRGQKVRFLVDTGSDVTILPYDRYKAIPDKYRPILVPLLVPLYGATGHPLDVQGTCRIPLGVGREEIPVDCTIVDGGVCPILGMNFMREHKVSLDFGSGEMRFGSTTLCLSGIKAPQAFTVEMVENLKVPAYHEVVAKVRPQTVHRNYQYVRVGY